MIKKKVTLVLSSGNARGFAHIGAIEALEERGYEITSVAGTSIGSMIAGMYATGEMEEFKDWLYNLDRQKVASLIDLSLSLNHLVKGERVFRAMREQVPDRPIESLRIPYRAVATDINTYSEVVFDRGSLYRAIRASISIPSLFRPIRSGKHLLIDGGATNPLPLNRAVRTPDSLLVAVDVSAPGDHTNKKMELLQPGPNRWLPEFVLKRFPSLLNHEEKKEDEEIDFNYVSLLSQTFSAMIASNTALMLKLCPPDMLLSIPVNRLESFDYDKAETIAQVGYTEMMRVINEYEEQNA